MLKKIFHQMENRFPAFGHLIRLALFGKNAGNLKQTIRGKDNIIQVAGVEFKGLEIDIIGDRNEIQIGRGSVLYNLKIRIRGSDHRIEVGEGCRITRGGVFWIEDDHCVLKIGSNTTIVEASFAVTEPGSRITIGQECMFANDIDIRVGDSHSVIDAETGMRINFAEDIMIDDHVWVAAHTVVLKGVNIGKNSVIATGAIVTKSCQPGSIMAGNPARVIKTGITWDRARIKKKDDL
jgi:acetyltransferase-like isoleucine patch superfamily enzyme